MANYFVEATYLYKDGCRFDFDHYRAVHVPLAEAQMAKGGLSFVRRILKTDTKHFFTGEPVHTLSLIYVLEAEADVTAFQQFMQTDHVKPLIEDAEKYTDCELLWTSGVYDEL